VGAVAHLCPQGGEGVGEDPCHLAAGAEAEDHLEGGGRAAAAAAAGDEASV